MTNLRFRKLSFTPFARLPGFSKARGHYVPEKASPAAIDWAKSLLDENTQEELQLIYQRVKDILGLRRRQVAKSVEKGGGSIETEFFRYTLSISQSESDPEEVKVSREITLLKPLNELPPTLDLIFPDSPEEIVTNLEVPDFDELVEQFEDLKEKWGGKLTENDVTGRIEYQGDGFMLEVDTKAAELVIRPAAATGCLALLKIAEDHLPAIAEALPGIPDLG
jgi:hypothetical protein